MSQREILFKAKTKKTSDWVKGYYVFAAETLGKDNIHVMFDGYGLNREVEIKPETLCQYTGITDKNGKKIFEGDRIRFETFEKETIERVVFWDDEYSRFSVFLNEKIAVGVNRHLSRDIEVIGNIHDN